jgi:predicted negative regulator of RcsB-dependent stress response
VNKKYWIIIALLIVAGFVAWRVYKRRQEVEASGQDEDMANSTMAALTFSTDPAVEQAQGPVKVQAYSPAAEIAARNDQARKRFRMRRRARRAA